MGGAHELTWGRHYLMCRPEHFDVRYAINPWMRPEQPVDVDLARGQWEALVSTLRAAGAHVDLLPAVEGLPDMVYAMNLAVVDGAHAVLGRFRHPERRPETAAAMRWLTERGYRVDDVGPAGGGSFEPGDGFLLGDTLLLAHGPRSDQATHRLIGDALDVRVASVRTVDERLYHLDLALCPLDERRAIVASDAWDAAGVATVRQLVPEPVEINRDEAATFCANSVVVGRTVVMPACPPRVGRLLESWGFDVVVVDVSELHRGGGSVRCMTLPLDLSLDAARRTRQHTAA
jgi:arginine dihydrolase